MISGIQPLWIEALINIFIIGLYATCYAVCFYFKYDGFRICVANNVFNIFLIKNKASVIACRINSIDATECAHFLIPHYGVCRTQGLKEEFVFLTVDGHHIFIGRRLMYIYSEYGGANHRAFTRGVFREKMGSSKLCGICNAIFNICGTFHITVHNDLYIFDRSILHPDRLVFIKDRYAHIRF